MAGSILGTRVLRTEDPELLTGSARYLNDLDLPGKLHAVFARSEVAHATLGAVHIDDALATPGVVAVFTADDLGVAPHHGFVAVHPDFARPPLADGVVRFVGEAIAVVVAETVTAADRRRRRGVGRLRAARRGRRPRGGASTTTPPVIFPDHGCNQALVVTDADALDLEAISDVVVRGRYVNQRMAVVPMEPNGCAAVPGDDGRLTFYASTQMPHGLHGQLAAALGIDAADIHVDRPQVGGGVRRQGRDLPRVLGGRRRGPPPRPAGHVVADPQRRPRVAAPQPRPDPVRRARLPPRRHVHRAARPPRRRRRRLPGHRRLPARRHQAHVQRHLPLPGHPVRRRRRRHQHHADGRLPRRRAARGDGAARAPRRPRRARARHRPDRAAPAQPPRRRRLPVHHAHRRHLRQRALRHAARRRRRGGRLRRAARASRPSAGHAATASRSASASPPTSRSPPAAGPTSSAPSRSTTTARPPCAPARRPTARATRPRSP